MAQMTEHCYVVTDDRILNGEPILKGLVRPYEPSWRSGVLELHLKKSRNIFLI